MVAAMQSIDTGIMSEPTVDYRNRPVVFRTQAEPDPRKHRRPIRVLATITLVIAALAGATGLAYGGSAVWSVVGPKAPANEPAPLWLPEPQPVVNKPDGGLDRSESNTERAGTPSTANSESGDGRSGGRGGAATTSSGSGTVGGSGRSPGGPGGGSGNQAENDGSLGGSHGGSGHN